jgi:amidase
LLDTYLFLLGALNFSVMPPEQQEKMRDHLTGASDSYAKGALSSFSDWQKQNFKRLAYRAQWDKHFQSIDVFLLPTAFTAAFPHDHRPVETRTISLPEGGTRPYWDLLAYTSPASLTGCPATVAPAGLSRSGLPVGVQIVGPYLEDATTIRFAQLLAQEIGGFRPPPGYRSFS